MADDLTEARTRISGVSPNFHINFEKHEPGKPKVAWGISPHPSPSSEPVEIVSTEDVALKQLQEAAKSTQKVISIDRSKLPMEAFRSGMDTKQDFEGHLRSLVEQGKDIYDPKTYTNKEE